MKYLNYHWKEEKAIYITVNGRGDTVLLNQTLYEKQMAELEPFKIAFRS